MKNTQILFENEVILAKDQEIFDLKKRIMEIELLLKYYEERFLLSQRKLFGSSSEKSLYDNQITLVEVLEGVCDIFDESPKQDPGYDGCDEDRDEHEVEDAQNTRKPRRKKRTRKGGLPKDVPVQEIICELTEEERACPSCEATAEPFGNDYREEYVIIPARVEVRRFVARKYICRACEGEEHTTEILKADMPKPVIKHSFASPEAIAYVAYQKYVMGVPLNRQANDWKRRDVILSRQTLANWLIAVSEKYLEPLIEELKRQFLEQSIAHADETTFQVLKEEGKTPQSNSYLWVYRTGIHSDIQIVLADYQPNRAYKNPAIFLAGFVGFLHSDGYGAYHRLPNEIMVVGCWQHVRSKWDKALKVIKNPKDRRGTDELKGKRYCDKLFNIERELANLTPEQKYKKRLKKRLKSLGRGGRLKKYFKNPFRSQSKTRDSLKMKLKPQPTLESIMDDFFAWAATVRATPKSTLGEAVSYTLSQRKYLKNVLLDGHLEISNNRVERTIRPFVICRKNFLFANTPRGATAAANIFSLIETAKETDVDPFEYLTYVFKTAPNLDMKKLENLQALLPVGYKNIKSIIHGDNS